MNGKLDQEGGTGIERYEELNRELYGPEWGTERRKRQRGSAVLYVRMAATAQVGESGKVAGDGAMHEMPQTDCRGDCEA